MNQKCQNPEVLKKNTRKKYKKYHIKENFFERCANRQKFFCFGCEK